MSQNNIPQDNAINVKAADKSSDFKIIILLAAIVIAVTAAAFIPSLQNGFTNWDDDMLVLNNTHVRGLSLENIHNIFTSFHLGHYNPLVALSFAVEYQFFGYNPFIFHLSNLILHLINCVLVMWFIFLLTGNKITAFVVSALFGIHPMHVESVAWITERKDVLYSIPFLLSLIYYLHYIRKSETRFYRTSLLLFFIALMAKSMAVTLPLIIFAVDFYEQRKISKQTLKEKIPFFAMTVLFAVIAAVGSWSSGATRTERVHAFSENFFIANYGIMLYLQKLILPLNLSALYSYPPGNGLPLKMILSPVFVAAVFALAVFSIKKTNKIFFGFMFFIITLLPVLQLIPSGPAIAAERYTYISYIGLFLIFAEGFSYLAFCKSGKNTSVKILLFSVFALIILFFSAITFQRTKVWKDSFSLWSDVMKNYPYSAIAYNNRGIYFTDTKQYDKAMNDFNQAERLSPDYAKNYYNRGVLYEKLNMPEKAIEDYSKAIKWNPSFPDAHYNRANIYMNNKESEKAETDFSAEIKINPKHAGALVNRGILYFDSAKYDKAIQDLSGAIAADDNLLTAYIHRGNTYVKVGRYANAVDDYKKSVEINPDFLDGYMNLAYGYFLNKEYNKSLEIAEKLKERKYDFPEELYTKIKEMNGTTKSKNNN